MILLTNGDFVFKIAGFLFISVAFFYLGKHWNDGYQQLILFSAQSAPSVALSPNRDMYFNISALTSINQTQSAPFKTIDLAPVQPPPPPSPPPPVFPPPPPSIERFGIVDENGTMSDNFEVGEFDLNEVVDNWVSGNETELEKDETGSGRIRVQKFRLCPNSMSEYIPCLDNVQAIKRLTSTDRGEMFERHCPEPGRGLNCLVPAPKKYKAPIPWPKSRDEVWFSNVPHTRLVEDKGGQNWITRDKNKFKFPGGGTQFIHGADEYLDHISKIVPDIAFGRHTRVVLDIGCGVASFGAYLLSRNVITLSIAPKDIHENQIQFALERGDECSKSTNIS